MTSHVCTLHGAPRVLGLQPRARPRPPLTAALQPLFPPPHIPPRQIYSRTPNPGPDFIAEKRAVLAALGYPAEEVKDTPQARGREGGGRG